MSSTKMCLEQMSSKNTRMSPNDREDWRQELAIATICGFLFVSAAVAAAHSPPPTTVTHGITVEWHDQATNTVHFTKVHIDHFISSSQELMIYTLCLCVVALVWVFAGVLDARDG